MGGVSGAPQAARDDAEANFSRAWAVRLVLAQSEQRINAGGPPRGQITGDDGDQDEHKAGPTYRDPVGGVDAWEVFLRERRGVAPKIIDEGPAIRILRFIEQA